MSSLTSKQALIHDALANPGDLALMPKRSVSMSDLRALSNVTGDEYSVFTRGSQRLVIRGITDSAGRPVIQVPDDEMLQALARGDYGKWSGHVHPPGYSLEPGPADRPFLQLMNQQRSGIWGSALNGSRFNVFGQWATDDAAIQAQINSSRNARLCGGH